MPHIKIRITSPSPQAGQKTHEVLQIKTPDGFLSLTESGEVISTPREEKPAVGAAAEVNGDKRLGFETEEGPNAPTDAESLKVYSNVITEVQENTFEVRQTSAEQSFADENGERANAEFFLPRRELATFKVQLDAFKSKLEEEVIERFKLEDELKSERGIHEFETRTLQEQIEELEKCLVEKNETIAALESVLDENKKQGESMRLEMEGLQSFVARSKAETTRLRSEAITANDQAEEMVSEVELLRRKVKEDASEKNSIKKRFRDEIEDNSKEIEEMRNSLEEQSKINEGKERTIQSLGKEVGLYKEQVEELQKELSRASCKLSTDKESYRSLQESSKSEELFAMSNELNEVYRDHLETQSKMTLLAETLNTANREIEDVRHAEEKHSFELQNYKERFNELKDLSTALKEENRHLKNTLQKRSRDSREIRKKYLILETEVVWLREALNIVEMSKPDTFKGGVILEQPYS